MDLAIDKFDPARFGIITGSACSVLFPKKSAEVGQRTYAKKLAREKYFEFYDEHSTWQTEHGNMSEHEAFEYYQQHFSADIEKGLFKSVGDCGGTCDALGQHYGLDFKCPTSLSTWLDYMTEEIDPQQYHQAQMYMHIFERNTWKICAYLTETLRMGEYGLTYPVPQDKRMIVIDIHAEDGWVELLNERAPKIIQMRDHFYDELLNYFGPKKNNHGNN